MANAEPMTADTRMLRIEELVDELRAAGIPLGRGNAYQQQAASGSIRIGPHAVKVHRFGRHYRIARAQVQALIEEMTGEG